MRELKYADIVEEVAKLCIDANCNLGDDVLHALQNGLNQEVSPAGKSCLENIIKNAQIARQERLPICQDTGMAVFFVEYGQELNIVGGSFEDAVNDGVRRGYAEGFLRKSVVSDPFDRVNTKDNTPAVIHTKIVPGDKLKLTIAPKGFGSENMSAVKMLIPAQGIEGVKDFVLDTVSRAGANPCPPVIIGIGIGGTMEKAALMSKEALTRDVGTVHTDPKVAALEEELLQKINKIGIGPQGLGGRCTALAVHINTYPTHIAGLPVALNMSCHVTRHKTTII